MLKLRIPNWIIMAAICLSSCNLFHREPPMADAYPIAFCFQDASGNNIVEEIKAEQSGFIDDKKNINSNMYSLDIDIQNYINGKVTSGPHKYPALYVSSLEMIMHNKLGICLTNYFARSSEDNNVRKLTYNLQCPYIFGDEETHELVTYWELNDNIYSKCYRIEFEGQEITPQIMDNEYYSLGVIKVYKTNNE